MSWGIIMSKYLICAFMLLPEFLSGCYTKNKGPDIDFEQLHSYIDFKPRKIWLLSKFDLDCVRITCFPFGLPKFITFAEHFGLSENWAFIRSGDKDFKKLLDRANIPYEQIGDDGFLIKCHELKPIVRPWSITLLLFDERPNAEDLSIFSQLLKKPGFYKNEFAKYVFSKLPTRLYFDIEYFYANAVFNVVDEQLAQQIWEYLIVSHIMSQQVCSIEYAKRCVANLPMGEWCEKKLFYWGHRTDNIKAPEFVYLILDSPPIARQGDIIQYVFHNELPSVVLSEKSFEIAPFGEVRGSLTEPIMPAIIPDHLIFVWRVIRKSKGYIFFLEPFGFRHYADFLSLPEDAQVFYHWHVHRNNLDVPFWLQMPVKHAGMYFGRDDFALGGEPREYEYKFVFADSETSLKEIETLLGTDEKDKPWFSFYGFLGNEDFPIDRMGFVYDGEWVSAIYLEDESDIKRLLAYTAWSLFKERFRHFPNVIPDEKFCETLLAYLTGKSIVIEWADFSQEGSEYRLCIQRFVPETGSAKELPEGDRIYIVYSAGNWRIQRPTE